MESVPNTAGICRKTEREAATGPGAKTEKAGIFPGKEDIRLSE
jgi:hypothetical protein